MTGVREFPVPLSIHPVHELVLQPLLILEKEIKIKVILYNLSRLMISFAILSIVEEFYRAGKTVSHALFTIVLAGVSLRLLFWKNNV